MKPPAHSAGAGTATLTRRTVLTGTGLALASLQASAPPARAGIELPFDIRTLVEGAEFDDERIQCTYDAINLTAFLVGDIPFSALFRSDMQTLIPLVFPRVQAAAQAGLLEDPAQVELLLLQLQSAAPTGTLGAFFASSRQAMAPALLALLVALRRHGVRIPLPSSQSGARQRARVITRLVAHAGTLTFTDLFTRTHEDTPSRARAAVTLARSQGLFSWYANDRCCDRGGGATEGTDACVPETDKWCNLPPPSRSFCSISSDICPGDNPNRRG